MLFEPPYYLSGVEVFEESKLVFKCQNSYL